MKKRFCSDVLSAERDVKPPEVEDVIPNPKDEASLIEVLFDILSCQRCYDDRELDSRLDYNKYKAAMNCSNEDVLKQLSPVFNKTSVFGTRTQTVLLVRWDGNAIWKEKTMREPIDPNNPIWDERTFRVVF